MSGRLLQYCGLLVLGLAIPATEAADAQALLARIQRAAEQLDYEGIFVYQHGDQLESLRILHKVSDGGMRERLVSLNGTPREIIRTAREVHCYLPDENAVIVEHRRADRRTFPALLPEARDGLGSYYQVTAGTGGRVAGHKTQMVEIRPRDGFRYGYRLWADRASGLLLKATLLDEQHGLIEQYMFTQVAIGKSIPDSELQPENRGKGLVWHRADDPASTPAPGQWEARRLPPGYALSTRMLRNLPKRRHVTEHLVYSDGLAVVSVFVEPAAESSESAALNGLTRMGAIHAFGKVVDGHQVTVVGEAPAATIEMIAESVVRLP